MLSPLNPGELSSNLPSLPLAFPHQGASCPILKPSVPSSAACWPLGAQRQDYRIWGSVWLLLVQWLRTKRGEKTKQRKKGQAHRRKGVRAGHLGQGLQTGVQRGVLASVVLALERVNGKEQRPGRPRLCHAHSWASWLRKDSAALRKGVEEPNPREIDKSVLLEFSMRQRLFVCFLFCFGMEEANAALCLFWTVLWAVGAPVACSWEWWRGLCVASLRRC